MLIFPKGGKTKYQKMLCFPFKKIYSAEYPPDGAGDNFKKKKKKVLLASETQVLPVMEL